MTKNGSQCLLPWKYSVTPEETYNGCANPLNSIGGLWCPTETNSDGVYISGSGTWGFCKMKDEGGHCTSSGMCGILYPLIILVGQVLDIQ